MKTLIPLFIFIPFIGFLLILLFPGNNEKSISWTAFTTAGSQLLLATGFIIYWVYSGMPTINIKEIVLYRTTGYEFYLDLHFDIITAVYLLVGSITTFLITEYSKYYMHREKGYKRFFANLIFFFVGYSLTIFSGNFETLFIGWEILGISSFLLIAFYRGRYLPVKNAVKVFSIYRIGDIGIILAMWLMHHLWHENITFLKLNDTTLVTEHLNVHGTVGLVISLMILLSASAKSAMLPFSSWLPRAMEGPTPSSAIFYSSLSVHIGAFLLLRTHPFWDHQLPFKILVIALGLSTSFVATFSARVQSSIKAQVAYASIAQIGIIFVEIALGLETIALIHFAGNAFLRSYQLLVSPSAVTYLIKEQFYNFVPKQINHNDKFKKLKYTIYGLSLKEWNSDSLLYRIMWVPIKKIGDKLSFLTVKNTMFIVLPLYLITVLVYLKMEIIPSYILNYLPILIAFIALIMVLKSFSERKNVYLSWALIILNHLWITLAISFNEKTSLEHILFYLGGVLVSSVIGYWCLNYLKQHEKKVDLSQFQGHSYDHPYLALGFLLACLGLAGFPITTTFLGEDLLFTHVHADQVVLACLISLSFVIDGLSLIRMYARIFMGPHVKTYHEIAYRSS